MPSRTGKMITKNVSLLLPNLVTKKLCEGGESDIKKRAVRRLVISGKGVK